MSHPPGPPSIWDGHFRVDGKSVQMPADHVARVNAILAVRATKAPPEVVDSVIETIVHPDAPIWLESATALLNNINKAVGEFAEGDQLYVYKWLVKEMIDAVHSSDQEALDEFEAINDDMIDGEELKPDPFEDV